MKVLLIRVSSLGDVLHNMPIVGDILRHFPEAQIDWVVEENFVELVKLNPHVRKVIPFALRRWRKSLLSAATRAEIKTFKKWLQAETYDVILDTQGLLKTGVIMGLANGGAKVGLANGTEGSGYEPISRIFHSLSVPVDSRTHAVLRGRLVASRALGYDIGETQPEFGLLAPASETMTWLPEHDYAVFFHGTAGVHKKWPAHDWITIGKYLQQHQLPVLLAWGNSTEFLEAEQLAAHIPGAVVLPKLSMLEAVALAQRAALVVGVDTGLTHISAAYGRPTVEIYSASPRWKTEGNWSDQIINLGDTGAAPGAPEVIAAIERLIPSLIG
ncbi:heptosyltransferase-1 [Oxalobacteraceae bacterium GrIS 2.11]